MLRAQTRTVEPRRTALIGTEIGRCAHSWDAFRVPVSEVRSRLPLAQAHRVGEAVPNHHGHAAGRLEPVERLGHEATLRGW